MWLTGVKESLSYCQEWEEGSDYHFEGTGLEGMCATNVTDATFQRTPGQ